MALLKEGKTNWKFVLIVLIFALLVGGGVFVWQYWQLPKEEVKIPEIKAPEEKVLEEKAKEATPEEATEDEIKETTDWKDYTDKEIIEIGEIMACDEPPNPDNCHRFVASLLKNHIPLEIVNSEEKLREYFETGLNTVRFEGINRERLDKYSDKEIIIVFLKNYFTSKRGTTVIIVIKEETKDAWRVYDIEAFGNTGFQIQQLVKNEPSFFIAKVTGTGGTCVSVAWRIRIYRLENNKFMPIWDNVYLMDGKGIHYSRGQVEYTENGQIENMEAEISYIDLDSDGNLEIIKEGYWKTCKGEYACYEDDCTETVKEEKIYEVYKWNSQKQTFVEENIE